MFALAMARVAPSCLPTRHLSRTSAPYAPRPLNASRVAAPHNLSVSPTTCAPAAATILRASFPSRSGTGFHVATNRRDTSSPGDSPSSRRLSFSSPPAYSATSSSDGGASGRPQSPHGAAPTALRRHARARRLLPLERLSWVAETPGRLLGRTREPLATRSFGSRAWRGNHP
jgi:hypothetical protein